MISLANLKMAYPVELQDEDHILLREYLQYRILEIIYISPFAEKLVFLGGTCLQIVHDNRRFSEDLDLANQGLSKPEFAAVGDLVQRELAREGYTVTADMAGISAFRCRIRSPGLLIQHGLTGHKEQTLLIQLETEPQRYAYEPVPYFISEWDVRSTIRCCPLPLLMAQKCHAILDRQRSKGRDFIDVAFLLGLNVTPDLEYLHQKKNIGTTEQLANALLDHCAHLDMNATAIDVEKFVFDKNGTLSVVHFPQLIRQQWLRG